MRRISVLLGASCCAFTSVAWATNYTFDPTPTCNPIAVPTSGANGNVCAVSTALNRDFMCWYNADGDRITTVEIASTNSVRNGQPFRRNVEVVCDDFPGSSNDDVNVVFFLGPLDDDLVFRSTSCSCSCPTGVGGVPTSAGAITAYVNHNGTFPIGLGTNPALWGKQILVEVNGREGAERVWTPTINDAAKHPNLVYFGGYNTSIATYTYGIGDVNTGIDAVSAFGTYQFYFHGQDNSDFAVDRANGLVDFEAYHMGSGNDIVWDEDCDAGAIVLYEEPGDTDSTNCDTIQVSGEDPDNAVCGGNKCGIAASYYDCPSWTFGSGYPGPA